MYKAGLCKFSNVPVILWKCKLCCACDVCMWPKLQIFWKWVPENIPDQQKHVRFQKSKKVLNHSTLLYSVHLPFSVRFSFVRLSLYHSQPVLVSWDSPFTIFSPFQSLETVVLPLSHILVSWDCLFYTLSSFQSRDTVSFPLSVRFSLMRRSLFHSLSVSVSCDCPFTTFYPFQSCETVPLPLSACFSLVRLSLFQYQTVSIS